MSLDVNDQQKNGLSVPASVIQMNIANALCEDLGTGDLTASLITEAEMIRAVIVCREPAVICGIDWFNACFYALNKDISIQWHVLDGENVGADTTVCELSGHAKSLLSAERTALNFLQTLSGTATIARQYADKIRQEHTRILDTRKTIPGLRLAQKYAVLCGGCYNHRKGLYDAILIKENHLHAMGGVKAAVDVARKTYPDVVIEVEVESIEQLVQALNTSVDIIMLDNFDDTAIRKAVGLNKRQKKLEISGGVNQNTVNAYAAMGVDYVSVGEITKHVKAIDFSMRFLS